MTEENAPKRRGRPRKTQEPTKAPVVSGDTESNEKTSGGFSNEQLMQLLSEAMSKISTLENLNKFSDKPVVALRHSGHGPQMVIPLQDGKTAILQSRAPMNTAIIPLNDYRNIQENTDWLEKGYLYVDGENTEYNPNLVLDVESWIEERNDEEIERDVKNITSSATLNYIYDYTENKKPTGPLLTLREAAAKRMEELFDVVVIEDPRDSTGDSTIKVGRKR